MSNLRMLRGRQFILILAMVMIQLTTGLNETPAQDATNTESATEAFLPVYLSNNEAVVILRIGEHPPAPVIFDTGTNGNLLDTNYAAALALPDQGPIASGDGATGRTVAGFKTVLADAWLGSAPIRERDANVIPLSGSTPGTVGIFGPGSFMGQLIYLDLPNSRAVVYEKTSDTVPDGKAYPYLGRPGHRLPGIDVSLPGMTVQAILDTGSDRSTVGLPPALADKVPLIGRRRQVGTAHSISGDQPMYEAQVRGTVRIGPIALHNPVVTFDGVVPNVGLHLIRRMSLVMDPEGQRTWVVGSRPISRLSQRPYIGRYGIRSIRSGHGVLVFQRDGRPALNLKPLAPDLFELVGSDVILFFHRKHGEVTGFDQIFRNGEVVQSLRTDLQGRADTGAPVRQSQ